MDFGPVISHYGPEQAIEDGMLVEVPAHVRNCHAIHARTFITSNLWRLIEDENEHVQDGNLSMLLIEASRSFRSGDTSDMMRTDIRGTFVVPWVTVWGVIDGAGVTLMLPEDY